MLKAYNTALNCAKGLISGARHLSGSITGRGKTRRFINGQSSALSQAAQFEIHGELFWFHCASLGEYAIARPLMSELKRRKPNAQVALTFFSSTGVEALKHRQHPEADFVGYMPLDTLGNARALLDLWKPAAVLFMVSEYWPNILSELKRRKVPTFLVSCIFTGQAPHFKPVVGKLFRESLQAYTKIFCLDYDSKARLAGLGYHGAEVEGDPLVDNALRVSETRWDNAALRDFCSRGRTLICGSIHNGADLELIAPEINSHAERRYLLVPHEVDEASLRRTEEAIEVPSRRLSAYTPSMTERVMIVDNIGSLAYLYRLGTMAYIGGGFSRQLHSILEATVYGLPISFGPRTERKIIARRLLKLGVATTTATPGEFTAWAERYFTVPQSELEELRGRAMDFCRRQSGATARIITSVLESTGSDETRN